MALDLYYRQYGEAFAAPAAPVVLVHGLFGSGVNWGRIAGGLADAWPVVVPDLRNHGRSPHVPTMSYPEMAADLSALLDRLNVDSAILVGHSMGGKAAMQLALQHPGQVRGLVVVDVAPVAYPDRFASIFAALRALDLSTLEGRGQADARLRASLPGASVRQYLLQNLVLSDGQWSWRINLEVLVERIADIAGFPSTDRQYRGPTLFVHGSQSGYVRPEHRVTIEQRFPAARVQSIAGAGHWVYSEQPERFSEALTGFLARAALSR